MPTTALPQTLFDKLWPRHLVEQTGAGEARLYVDRHLVYEVTSPQAFEGLRLAGRKPWRRESVIATVDDSVPTTPANVGIHRQPLPVRVQPCFHRSYIKAF